jgi:hypothetical protein
VVQVRSLLGEVATVEDEIFYLEKKVDDLRLHRERDWNDRCVAVQPPQQRHWRQQDNRQPRHSSSCGLGCRKELFKGAEQLPRLPCPPAVDDTHEALDSECESTASPAPPERKICCLNSPNKLSEAVSWSGWR